MANKYGWQKVMDTVAERANCDRGRAAAVIVKDKRIVATGYVGAPAGLHVPLAVILGVLVGATFPICIVMAQAPVAPIRGAPRTCISLMAAAACVR